MDSSNGSWRASKPQSGHALTQETRNISVESVAAHNVHSHNATSTPDRPLEPNHHTQCASAPAVRASARVAAQTTQHQPGAADASISARLAQASISKANMPEASSSTPRYIPPALRSRLTEQAVAKQAVAKQPVADKPVAFAVQLYPDMSSITLAQHGHQPGSPVVFSGGEAPDHHSYTAFHHYIAHICHPKDAAAFGADVWLDTFHTTLGDLELPMSKVPDFQRSISTIAADSLCPDSLTKLTYNTTQLGYTINPNRHNKDKKGEYLYHVGVTAPADQLAELLQPWMAAMQHAAAAVGGIFNPESFSRHHITIRCHTKQPVEWRAFQRVVQAVQANPISLRVAGIRVQLAASQALEHCGPEHVMTHMGSDGSVVRYSVPIFTSGAAASVLLERGDQAYRPRAIPCNVPESKDGASTEELTRLIAEPLMTPAQNGTGIVQQNERDSTVPKCGSPTLPTSASHIPTNGDFGSSSMATTPEAKPVSTAAAFQLADLPGADPLPRGLLRNSDLFAEKVAELSMDANPAGLRPAKADNKERGNLLPLHVHS